MDHVFAFNGRMLVILALVLLVLMAVSFGLGMVYAGYAATPAAPVAATVKK
jgi:hypothetical protein